jgi:hypothetical protein
MGHPSNMAGKRGRSGRKPGSGLGHGMSAVEHAARGTYRPGVHGPLPPGVIPVSPAKRPRIVSRGTAPTMPTVTPRLPAVALTAEDCPAVLTEDGRALWGILVAQRPTEPLHGPFVTAYVEALLAWQRATVEVQKQGDVGEDGANPYLKLRRDAERTMLDMAKFLGWQTPVMTDVVEPPKSRLDLFLAKR